MTLADEFSACRASLTRSMPTASVARLLPTVERFEQFLSNATEHDRLSDVTACDIKAFTEARTVAGGRPLPTTVHNRRTILRRLFRAGRELGLLIADPTVDVRLPDRATRAARPLSDREVLKARDGARWSLTTDRYLFAWALAEATARGSELARIGWEHLNLDTGTVALPGGGGTNPRAGALTEWGLEVFRSTTRGAATGAILYTGDDPHTAGTVSATNAISRILIRAGLAGLPDVRPGSVTAWAGRRCMDQTGDIAAVARMLGVASLDVAARKIGWDWSTS